MFTQSWDLITFKAFKPSALDVKVQLKERMRETSVMGILLSSRCVTCAKIEITLKQTNITYHKTFILNNERDKITTLASFAREHGLTQAVVLCSPEFEAINTDQSLSLRGVDRLFGLKNKANEIFKEHFKEGRAYAYVGTPEAEESVKFSYNQEKIDLVLNVANKAGLEVVRITCGIYATFEYLVNETDFLEKEQLFFMYASNAVLGVSIGDRQFKNIGFKTKVYFKDLEKIVPKMIKSFDYTHNELTFVNCSDWKLHEFFDKSYPEMKCVSLFEDCKKGVFLSACHE